MESEALVALNIGLSEENMRGCSGGEVMVGWWYDGCTKACLCVSFSVVLVMILSSCYVGCPLDQMELEPLRPRFLHSHTITFSGDLRFCSARTLGISIEMAAWWTMAEV